MAPWIATSSQASKISAMLSEARARAIAEEREVRFDLIGGRQVGTSALVDGRWEIVRSATTFRHDVSMTIDGAASGSVRFLPQGRVDAPAVIVLTSATRTVVVNLFASGLHKQTRP